MNHLQSTILLKPSLKVIVLVYGLPGSGKTTLSSRIQSICQPSQVLWFNADKVRSTLSRDLGFKPEDRIEQARRMACVASLALDASENVRVAMVDFVNPNQDTYSMFRRNTLVPDGTPKLSDSNRVPSAAAEASYPVYSVFMNTIGPDKSRFADTAAMFNGDREADLVISEYLDHEAFELYAHRIVHELNEKFA